jgi:hypothetical protein
MDVTVSIQLQATAQSVRDTLCKYRPTSAGMSQPQHQLLRHYSSVRTVLPSNTHCLTFVRCCVVLEESCLLRCPVVLCTTTWKISLVASRRVFSRQHTQDRSTLRNAHLHEPLMKKFSMKAEIYGEYCSVANINLSILDMKRVTPTICYKRVYWNSWFAQHISGIIMPIIRSLRLYRWPQRVAPHFGYVRLLVWCMAVGLSVRVEGCCTITKVRCHTLGPSV